MSLRHLFVFTFLMGGCSESHLTMMTDAGLMPLGDAGPAMMAVPDSGTDHYEWPDSGPATPDSGSAVPDSGTPLTGGVTVVCESGTDTRETITGATGFDFYHFRVIPGDRPVRLVGVQVSMANTGFYGDVVGNESGLPYFTNWQLTVGDPYHPIATGMDYDIHPEGGRRMHAFIANSTGADPISEDTEISIRADVGDEEGRHTLTLGTYTVSLSAAGFHYSDTGEEVTDIRWEGCEGVPLPQTRVRLNAADIIVDRVSEDPSVTVRDGAVRTSFLRLAALNDGAVDGTLDRIVFDTRAVIVPASGGERPASIRDAVSACRLVRDSSILATGRFEGEQIVFEHAGLEVTTSDRGSTWVNFAYFNVECDVRLNSAVLPLYGALRVWLSAHYNTGITIEESEPARVVGTLSLDQNTHPSIAEAGSSMYVQIIR